MAGDFLPLHEGCVFGTQPIIFLVERKSVPDRARGAGADCDRLMNDLKNGRDDIGTTTGDVAGLELRNCL